MAEQEIPIGKLVLIGDSGVGKTSMFTSFMDRRFTENTMATLGVEYKIKNLDLEGKLLKLMIWDTSGQEKYNALSKMFYQKSDGMMIVFSLTDRSSFEHVGKWMERVFDEAPRDVSLMLIGRSFLKRQQVRR